jgi:hypothetical protein
MVDVFSAASVAFFMPLILNYAFIENIAQMVLRMFIVDFMGAIRKFTRSASPEWRNTEKSSEEQSCLIYENNLTFVDSNCMWQ